MKGEARFTTLVASIFAACTWASILSPTHAVAEPMKVLEAYEIDGNIKAIDELVANGHPQADQLRAAQTSLSSDLRTAGRSSARGGELSPRIVNGVPTAAFPTTGALLRGSDPSSAAAHCSGTLIGCNVFLTAAHCVEKDPTADGYLVYLQHGGIFPLSAVSYPKDLYDFPDADVAVLWLQQPVDGISPSPINDRFRVRSDTDGSIVGFGRSGGFEYDYGVKQVGRVTTRGCEGALSDDNLICWRYGGVIGAAGEDSNTCQGDSGGSFFVDLDASLGPQPMVAGVTSGGKNVTCLATDHSYDASVYQFRTWITGAVGDGLHAGNCGQLPQVGTLGVIIQAFDGKLDSAETQKRIEFGVPSGASVLRVAMNAADDGSGGNDFNLYVKFGVPPSEVDYDCAQAGSGQFGFCEIDNPGHGEWHILVTRKKGAGKYQVVATVFG